MECRIAVRFAYECLDDSGNWFRAYGNENSDFNEQGLMLAPTCEHQEVTDHVSRSQVPFAFGKAARRRAGLKCSGPLVLRPCCQRSNSTSERGVEQQIKTFPAEGRSSGSGE